MYELNLEHITSTVKHTSDTDDSFTVQVMALLVLRMLRISLQEEKTARESHAWIFGEKRLMVIIQEYRVGWTLDI